MNRRKVFDGDIQTWKEEEAQIRSELRKSTIPCNHYVLNLCMELTHKLVNLTSQKPAEQIDASICGRKNPSSTQIRLPKLALPIFKGDPMDWAGFWAQFRSSVHDYCDLDETQKLTYLREAIKNHEVTPLLYRATQKVNIKS